MDLLIKHEAFAGRGLAVRDRKSTRLNSSHSQISYAVFCLKKKKADLLNAIPFSNKYIDLVQYQNAGVARKLRAIHKRLIQPWYVSYQNRRIETLKYHPVLD